MRGSGCGHGDLKCDRALSADIYRPRLASLPVDVVMPQEKEITAPTGRSEPPAHPHRQSQWRGRRSTDHPHRQNPRSLLVLGYVDVLSNLLTEHKDYSMCFIMQFKSQEFVTDTETASCSMVLLEFVTDRRAMTMRARSKTEGGLIGERHGSFKWLGWLMDGHIVNSCFVFSFLPSSTRPILLSHQPCIGRIILSFYHKRLILEFL